MSTRSTKNVVQAASKASKVRHAAVKSGSPNNTELGREIFVYNHLQTNQVVYSLTKGVNVRNAVSLISTPDYDYNQTEASFFVVKK